MKKTEPLKILVPVSCEEQFDSKEKIVETIRELHDKYRFTMFGLHCPGKGWRSSAACPPPEYFVEKAELLRDVKTELAPEGISVGWWNTLTIKTSIVPEWQKVVRADGSCYGFTCCPLDSGFRKWLMNSMSLFAKTGKPDFIMTEDDFGLHGGCFCERHLAEFSRREGRIWTREELVRELGKDSPEARALLLRWSALKRDTLADFAADIRAAVDAESPEIPIGTCQSGSWDSDGDATDAVTRAFAGAKHRPFSRLFGTFYAGEDIASIPEVLQHPLYYRQTLPEDYICLHESDTYPHTRFYTSAACMRVMMSSVYSQGFDGSVFQAGYLYKDRAYAKMHAEEIDRFQAIHDAAAHCTLKGVRLPYIPVFCRCSTWTRCVSHFGIPYTTSDAPVTFLCGSQIDFLSDDFLKNVLSKGAFIDGDAADALVKRGFGNMIGCDVGPNPVCGAETYDLGGYEQIEDGFLPDNPNRTLPRAGTYSLGGDGRSYNLIPHAGTEVITRIFTWRKRELGIAMIRCRNQSGGRVVVLGMGTGGNFSSALFHYQRQKLIQEQLDWCGAGVVCVKDEPRVFPVMNEAVNPAESGFFGMVTLSSLNADEIEEVSLKLPENWRQVQCIRILGKDGTWQAQIFEKTHDGVRIPVHLVYTHPQVLLFS